jgi:hypothetical protein
MATEISPVWDISKARWKLQRVVDEMKETLAFYERHVAQITTAEEKVKFIADPYKIYTPGFDWKTCETRPDKTREECMEEQWQKETDELEASRQRKIKRLQDAEFELALETEFLKDHVEMHGEDVKYLNAAQPESPDGVEGFYKVKKVEIIYKAHTIQAYEMILARVINPKDEPLIGYSYIVPKCVLPSKGIGISYITPREKMFE